MRASLGLLFLSAASVFACSSERTPSDANTVGGGGSASLPTGGTPSNGGTPMFVSADRYTNEFYSAPSPDGKTLAFAARGISSGQWWRKGHSHLDESEIWLVHGMVEIAHALGLTVVAEGVETREAWNVLRDWGYDFAQGFYVAAPRPADELVEWLRGSWPAVA